MSNPNDLKRIARESFEDAERKDFSALESITDKGKYKLHFPGVPKALSFEESKELMKEYYNAFPDSKATFDQQFVDGEYVISRVTFNGTHKGEFQGVRPTNKKVKSSGVCIQHIVNNKIVEEWDEFDTMGMMQQIGAVPESASQTR